MSWEAGPSALTLPGKHTRLTAAAEASGDGVCTESLPPEGSGDSLLGSGVAEPAQSWGRGLICAPLLASGLPVSCRDPRTPSERDLWVGGQGRPRDLLEELPGEGSPCGFSNLPYDVTTEQALTYPEVRTKLEASIEHLRRVTDQVLNSIISSLDLLP